MTNWVTFGNDTHLLVVYRLLDLIESWPLSPLTLPYLEGICLILRRLTNGLTLSATGRRFGFFYRFLAQRVRQEGSHFLTKSSLPMDPCNLSGYWDFPSLVT